MVLFCGGNKEVHQVIEKVTPPNKASKFTPPTSWLRQQVGSAGRLLRAAPWLSVIFFGEVMRIIIIAMTTCIVLATLAVLTMSR
ncbi:hypothetical protein DFR28_1111, partial [Arenicella xantha]